MCAPRHKSKNLCTLFFFFFFLSPHPLVVVSRGGFHFFFFLFLLTFIILIIMIPLYVYVCSKKGRKFHLRGEGSCRRPTPPSIHRGGEMMVGGRDDYVAFFFFFILFFSYFFGWNISFSPSSIKFSFHFTTINFRRRVVVASKQ